MYKRFQDGFRTEFANRVAALLHGGQSLMVIGFVD
jgi:hypothetical protein